MVSSSSHMNHTTNEGQISSVNLSGVIAKAAHEEKEEDAYDLEEGETEIASSDKATDEQVIDVGSAEGRASAAQKSPSRASAKATHLHVDEEDEDSD
ncbi:hypothetical protein U1Q18_014388 [Sarracenia purpurea var. burkii]